MHYKKLRQRKTIRSNSYSTIKHLIEFHKNTEFYGTRHGEMKYYRVSITACRLTLIDFFTPKTAWSVGVWELQGVSADHDRPIWWNMFVFIITNVFSYSLQESIPVVRGARIIWMFSKITCKGGLTINSVHIATELLPFPISVWVTSKLPMKVVKFIEEVAGP